MRQHSIAWQESQAEPAITRTRPVTTVDLVVPVYNEESGLAESIEKLLAAGTARSTEVTIIIADTASTDSTPAIGATLAESTQVGRCIQKRRCPHRVWWGHLRLESMVIYAGADSLSGVSLRCAAGLRISLQF
ncbi:glycosyltransferase [Brevibacterium picturae]|uniref:Glycosyltransferase 2-like domain-containing protein n=1 Tax=Brevibacterium picturae TaxID=260553 RepID=A0ABP4M1Y8_9MICO